MSEELPSKEELRESRRQSLLQKYVNGAKLNDEQTAEIADLIREHDGSDETCSVEYLAKISGYSTREIQRFAEAEKIPKPHKGRYAKDACLQSIFAILRAKRESRKEVAAKERKEEAQAEKAEIEVAQLKGELMFRQDASQLFADLFVRIRQTIDEESEIPDAVKQRLSAKFLDIKFAE